MVRDRDKDYVRPLQQKLFGRAIATTEQLLGHAHFVRQPRRPKVPAAVNLTSRYRLLTLKDMQRIIYKRFGSLTEVGVPIRSFAEVSRQLTIPAETVRVTVRRFLERGSRIEDIVTRRPRYKMLSEEMRAKLLSKPLLLK